MGVACFCISISIIALHFIPWEKFFGRPLQPPWTYVAGCAAILFVYTAWAWWTQVNDPRAAIWGLWLIVAAGGVADFIAYFLDRWGGLEQAHRTGGMNGAVDRLERD